MEGKIASFNPRASTGTALLALANLHRSILSMICALDPFPKKSVQDYNDAPEMGMEEQDMIDNAAEPNLGNENDQTTPKEATERITTKFLTKYEKGMFTTSPASQQSYTHSSTRLC